MSFTGTNLLADVRVALDDAGAAVWTDAELCVHANRALLRLRADFPESVMDSEGARTAHTTLISSGLGNTLPVPDQYRPILVEMTCALAHMQDGNDKDDRERSAMSARAAADALGPRPGYPG